MGADCCTLRTETQQFEQTKKTSLSLQKNINNKLRTSTILIDEQSNEPDKVLKNSQLQPEKQQNEPISAQKLEATKSQGLHSIQHNISIGSENKLLEINKLQDAPQSKITDFTSSKIVEYSQMTNEEINQQEKQSFFGESKFVEEYPQCSELINQDSYINDGDQFLIENDRETSKSQIVTVENNQFPQIVSNSKIDSNFYNQEIFQNQNEFSGHRNTKSQQGQFGSFKNSTTLYKEVLADVKLKNQLNKGIDEIAFSQRNTLEGRPGKLNPLFLYKLSIMIGESQQQQDPQTLEEPTQNEAVINLLDRPIPQKRPRSRKLQLD